MKVFSEDNEEWLDDPINGCTWHRPDYEDDDEIARWLGI